MIKLHFYANETLKYKEKLDIGPMWKLIQRWQPVAETEEYEIHIGPSDKEEEITKYRTKCTGKDHPIPHRHRTILEVNNKIIYFDCQDQNGMGADLHLVPDIFDLCIKFQYNKNGYKEVPFKVSPFTYFCLSDDNELRKYRKIREQICESKSFKSSIMWAGAVREGRPNRQAVVRNMKKLCKKGLLGRVDSYERYYQRICETVAGASARGTGEFCHRDIEFMAIGTPFFRKEFNTQTYNPLISNTHYYSIGGDEAGIDKTMEHFINYFEPEGEIRSFMESEWVEYKNICKESMKWHEHNSTLEASFKLLIHILKENNIL